MCYLVSLVDKTAKRIWRDNKVVNDIFHLSPTSEPTLITTEYRHSVVNVKINVFKNSAIIFNETNLQNYKPP